jgi:trk system potassium uptake protein TrkH
MARRALVLFLRASDIGKRKLRLAAPALLGPSLLLEAAPDFPGRGLVQGLLSLAIPLLYFGEDLEKAWRSPSPLRHIRQRWLDLLVLATVGIFGLQRASLLLDPGAFGTTGAIQRLVFYSTVFYTAALLKLVTRARQAVDFLAHLDLRPSQTIAVSFFGAALLGSLLLTLPQATVSGVGTSFVDALFMAMSAVCVTGLAVLDIGSQYTLFGQLVILALIQAGGLGIMTLAALATALAGRRLRVRDQVALQGALDAEAIGTIRQMIRAIVFSTFLAEVLGSGILFLRWRAEGPEPWHVAYRAVFHSISAFCNAGFSLFADSLVRYAGDPISVLTFTSLIILGGLGFPVLATLSDLFRERPLYRFEAPVRRGWKRLTLHTKVALTVTAVLLVAAMALLLMLEWGNTLAGRPFPEKLLVAYFQAVTPRTAGFNTVPIAELAPASLFLLILLMFIGGCSGGTAGGIKTTTVGVMTATLRAILRNRDRVELFERTIPQGLVNRATAVTLVALAAVALAVFGLALTESGPFISLAFEAVSAFGTVGLSMGITPSLTDAGRLIVTATMFVGRIGPLTLALALAERPAAAQVTYPTDRVMIG